MTGVAPTTPTLPAMPARPLTLMAVHAHPDDEASKGAATMARYAAEGVRTVPYMLAFAFAPLLFGFISDSLGARDAGAAAASGGVANHANGLALSYTFLIMLIPTAIAGRSLLWAVRTYPRDVATAAASTERTDPQMSQPQGNG